MNGASRTTVMALVAALLAGAVLYPLAKRTYFAPRAELAAQLAESIRRVEQYRSALRGRAELHERLRSIVDRTLGGDLETVDHRLRTRLNRIAEDLQLRGATVSTGTPRQQLSPAQSVYSGRAFRALREEVDFVELPGTIAGEGSIEQVVALIDRIQAEPWLKRIYQIRLDPRDNGARFNVTLRLVTLYLPGVTPSAEPREPYDAGRLGRYAPLLDRNPFHLPAPKPEAPASPSPPADRGFPFENWTLTGVAEGARGPEAWLLDRRSGESRRLAVGEAIDAVHFVAASGDLAEFVHESERFLVAVGSHLSDRQPVNE